MAPARGFDQGTERSDFAITLGARALADYVADDAPSGVVAQPSDSSRATVASSSAMRLGS